MNNNNSSGSRLVSEAAEEEKKLSGSASQINDIALADGNGQQNDVKSDFTEVFSWGSDRFGQLGLGKQVQTQSITIQIRLFYFVVQRQIHCVPRFCSYNIPIISISCGTSHSIFITSQQLVYAMGSNAQGQLGIDDPYTQQRCSPVLIEGLIQKKSPVTQQPLVVSHLSCGSSHTLALMRNGEVYSWGNNEHGQCGTGKEPFLQIVHWGPQLVKFDDYHNPVVTLVNAGAAHSAFIDEIGRLFMCGRGESGQLGNMSYLPNLRIQDNFHFYQFDSDEAAPYYVQKIPDKMVDVACGEDHTLVLTKNSGEIYVMGSNQRGQLGIGGPSRGTNVPVLLAELTFTKIAKLRAGAFSAAMSQDSQLYLWGTGSFGQFYTPHRVKSVNKLEISDFQLGRSGFIALLTREGQVYTWGANDAGQLGHRDTIHRSTPHQVEALASKKVTQICCGRDFLIGLGLTLPHKELELLNKKKLMLDQATKINNETEQHARSTSKTSVKLRRDYESYK